ncbi:unnamed protein product [Sympodiomycopsis kandeliae]
MPQCSSCLSSDLASANSQLVCMNCGTVLEESQIVSDVTFGENSAGGAVVQGSYVGSDQTHVRSSNPRFRSSGAGESREQTIYRAREAIERMGRANKVGNHVRERALRWFRLALDGVPSSASDPNEPKNFVLGRKQEYTVASCLYVACRMEKTTHMLIDFSDAMSINVFELGRHYLQLVRALNLQLPVLDPSIYIMRFAALLDFGEHTNKVAQDASRLCARFKKDWLVDGRRPAGICGACLLLAARMNNFRRSMNEIVQVVKMADVTIRQRLEEFKQTPSGNLTVADFKSVWLEEEYEPPAFYKPQIAAEKQEQKEKKRLAKEKKSTRKDKKPKTDSGSDVGDEEGNEADEEDDGNDDAQPADKHNELEPELDALATQATQDQIEPYVNDEMFKALDMDAQQRNEASAERARRGDVWGPETLVNPLRPTASGFEDDTNRAPSETTAVNQDQHLSQEQHVSIKESASQAEQRDDAVLRAEADQNQSGPSSGARKLKPESQNADHDNLDDLDEDELDQFILGPEEVKIKERVWMEFNHDYLQHALLRQLKEEADEKAGIKKRPSRRRGPVKPRDSSTAPSNSAAESARQMMQQKKKFSKKINYDALQGLFTGMDGAVGQSSRAGKSSKGKKADRQSTKKRGRGEYATSGDDTTDGETLDARGNRLFGNADELDDSMIIEEEATLPNNHRSVRNQSKAERELKAKKNKRTSQTGGATTDDGDESGLDFGQQYNDGATTDGDMGELDDETSLTASLAQRYGNRGVDLEADGDDY